LTGKNLQNQLPERCNAEPPIRQSIFAELMRLLMFLKGANANLQAIVTDAFQVD
jgi:hypothetical protein